MSAWLDQFNYTACACDRAADDGCRVACGRDNFDTKRRRPPRTGRDDGPAVDPNGPNSDRTDAACACDRAADDSCNLRPIVVDGLIDAVSTGEYNELRVGLWLLFVGTPRFEQEPEGLDGVDSVFNQDHVARSPLASETKISK